jgi:hypothetical protein
MILGIWFREQQLLKDILARLGHVEERMDRMESRLSDIDKRLVVLETRAGGSSREAHDKLRPVMPDSGYRHYCELSCKLLPSSPLPVAVIISVYEVRRMPASLRLACECSI